MNYLAHLYLAQPTPDSHFGNLLGDFRRGVDTSAYSADVVAGLRNHYLVDAYTDNHPYVKEAKSCFSAQRRRFAGIALDVLFDHYLIKHWLNYSATDFDSFCDQAYQRLEQRIAIMPAQMQPVVGSMVEQGWLSNYRALNGVAFALDKISARIRFPNQFNGSIEEITPNYQALEECFTAFFPQLIAHVAAHSPEL
ncbi:DUF479 domain-containing protein [Alteromonas pelagimontana]|uniref:DUF479 domain-containing protein n=1 Tax=Alteromonas pelagimontana TaxID=1858656 RepID=A0A6M4MDM6_9ALTE|nr:ACP phosphodiesterase [Alteromonas pelagimontana]QJR81209.1 DUF479 domain-containing protein [Alteromonas pelagimontana]